MRASLKRTAALGAVPCALLLAVSCRGGGAAFSFETVADGIALYHAGPAGSCNSLVVERGDGLLVVDAQPTPAAALRLLAAIEARYARPVRYLVLSSPHAESAGGASAFPASTLVVSSFAAAEALADPGYDWGAEERARAADPEKWAEPPRPVPTLQLRATVELADPSRPVQLRVHARAHSRGDLSVYLPAAGVLYVGGLAVGDGNPYGVDADVGRWLGLLNAIIVDAPRFVVGLRGPAADVRPLIALRDALAWLRGQVEEGFIDRLPPEETIARVLADPGLRERFAVDDEPSFLPDLVRRVVEEGIGQRRKRGSWPGVSPPAGGAEAERGSSSPGSS